MEPPAFLFAVPANTGKDQVMPAYDYRCTQCNDSFQVRKQMSEIDTETRCPACGSLQTRRRIGNVAMFSSSDGVRRALAGVPSCAGCSLVGTGCTSCGPR
jgi:putative FmdB family regulatory protein